MKSVKCLICSCVATEEALGINIPWFFSIIAVAEVASKNYATSQERSRLLSSTVSFPQFGRV